MLQFIESQIFLYLAMAIVLFAPGYFLLWGSGLKKNFSALEIFLLSSGLSLIITDFLMIIIGKFGLSITRTSLLISLAIFCLAFASLYYFRKDKNSAENSIAFKNLSKRSGILVILLLFLTIFIKTTYLTNSIFPTTTDLGHHMYWTKEITTSGKLPVYEKSDINFDYTISEPAPIADFIIGEHLPFAAISLISGADFLSAFPVTILYFIQMLSILAIFILARYFFKEFSYGDTVALVALFLIGPLYAIASPQIKFASGGVIGNDIGNFLIPLILLLFLRAFAEKSSPFLALALFSSLGLAYTHHLSTFVFIFIAIYYLLFFAIFNFKNLKNEINDWLKISLNPKVISMLIFGAAMVFVFYMPTYLNTKAIDTAVGAPSKASRAGLTITQLKTTAGEARAAFALAGILLLFFVRKMEKYSKAFLGGWLIALSVMSLRPDWLFVNIPSNRIASYIVFPTAIMAAFAFTFLFDYLKSSQEKGYLKMPFLLSIFFIFMIFAASSGFFDNQQSLNLPGSSKSALQTYAASTYLAERSTASETIVKDHNYISGDSWIKLFFMRGYNYPFSRGYFKRYQDETKPREQCTNLMISAPSSNDAKKCFTGTSTDFLMINPKFDSGQFQHLNNFWQVYSSDEIGIFYKSN